jgi:hypothetical protein
MVVQPHDATLAWHLSRNLRCPGADEEREKADARSRESRERTGWIGFVKPPTLAFEGRRA